MRVRGELRRGDWDEVVCFAPVGVIASRVTLLKVTGNLPFHRVGAGVEWSRPAGMRVACAGVRHWIWHPVKECRVFDFWERVVQMELTG